MKRASYRNAIDFIAWNDEPTIKEVDDMVGYASVALVADIFGVTQERVARDVVRLRVRALNEAKLFQTFEYEHAREHARRSS